LLSEAGSKYGDDDVTSHYAQSQYGNVSNFGGMEPSVTGEQAKPSGSRRQ